MSPQLIAALGVALPPLQPAARAASAGRVSQAAARRHGVVRQRRGGALLLRPRPPPRGAQRRIPRVPLRAHRDLVPWPRGAWRRRQQQQRRRCNGRRRLADGFSVVLQVDSLRVVSEDFCELIHRVPRETVDAVGVGSIAPASRLLKTLRAFQEGSARGGSQCRLRTAAERAGHAGACPVDLPSPRSAAPQRTRT